MRLHSDYIREITLVSLHSRVILDSESVHVAIHNSVLDSESVHVAILDSVKRFDLPSPPEYLRIPKGT